MRVSQKALEEIEEALRLYEREVQAKDMTTSTKKTYLLHSTNFVRWRKGEFEPGARNV